MQNTSQKIISYFIAFVLILGFITTVFKINPSPGPVYENRTLQGIPTAPISDLSKYTVQADNYINDNFGFRLVLIYYYAVFRHFILHANDGENLVLESLGAEK